MPDRTDADTPKIADLKRRMVADPTSRIFLDLAREYHEQGQLEAAADVCARGLKRHPAYLSARVLQGRILFEMGRADEAREAMETVLDQAPDNLVARRVLAEICLETGDVIGALDRLRALLAFNPTDGEIRGRIDALETQLKAAAAAATAPEPARPSPSSAAPAPAPARPSGAGAILEEVPEAGQAIEPIWEPEPATLPAGGLDAGVLATPTLAEIYMQQGLKEKAAQVYREILRGDPGNEEAAARLAEIAQREPPPPDPADQARRRKIAALNSWIAVIRGRAGV